MNAVRGPNAAAKKPTKKQDYIHRHIYKRVPATCCTKASKSRAQCFLTKDMDRSSFSSDLIQPKVKADVFKHRTFARLLSIVCSSQWIHMYIRVVSLFATFNFQADCHKSRLIICSSIFNEVRKKTFQEDQTHVSTICRPTASIIRRSTHKLLFVKKEWFFLSIN